MKDSGYVKRTQKDYSLNFKLQVVQEIEHGELSQHGAVRKYGIQARSTILSWLCVLRLFLRACKYDRCN